MKRRTLTFAIFSLFCVSCMTPEGPSTEVADKIVRVTMDDFKSLEGDKWTGSLSYLNYNSDDRSTIPVKLAIKVLSDKKLQYAIQYPGEESHNAREVLKLSKEGSNMDGAKLISRQTDADGVLILTTETKGEDDNKPADIQTIYKVSPNIFIIRKNVRFETNGTFFNRNEYSFTR